MLTNSLVTKSKSSVDFLTLFASWPLGKGAKIRLIRVTCQEWQILTDEHISNRGYQVLHYKKFW